VREEELRLDDVVAALLRRWRLILLVAVPVLIGVLLYASSLPTTWRATSTVSFAPRPQAAVGADTVTLLVPAYVAFVRSPATEQAVGTQYSLDATALDRQVDVSVPPTTATMNIAVTGDRPQQVADVANALASAAVAHATQDAILTASVVSKAVPPQVPAGPRRRLLELSGLVGALLLGLLVAAAVERGFPRLRSAGDVQTTLDLELLGRLPRTDALRHLGGEALEDPLVGTAVRSLRDHLLSSRRHQPLTVLAVCSAGRREGRSTVTALLAHAFTRLELQVLMIDADAARHALSEEYLLDLPQEVARGRDLEAVLAGRHPLEAAPFETGVPNLSILPSTASPELGDLVARRMGPLLAALRLLQAALVPAGLPDAPAPSTPAPAYDLVLIDTPALLERNEAALLAGLADATVLVVDSGRQSAPVHEAASLLATAGARVLGVVLNRAPPHTVVRKSSS